LVAIYPIQKLSRQYQFKRKKPAWWPAFRYWSKPYFLVGLAGAAFGLAATVSVFFAGAVAFLVFGVAIFLKFTV